MSQEIGSCSGTKLKLELDGVTPLPEEVILRVTRDIGGAEIVNKRIRLGGDAKYYWSGLLAPLGKYRAELLDVKEPSIALARPFAFNNIDILKYFVKERGEIVNISRGGNEPQNNELQRNTLSVNQLPAPSGKNQIHIVVMNDRGIKADEYFGPSPREQMWTSKPLRFGKYRLMVAEYKEDQTCQILRGR